ncbi:peroxidase-related enzyme [Streptomyces sp. NPDC004629]|uniref:peroxidase-related enzyme n=1 Tax=Streptomyces sp. NPDC004629 TaxID=3364705 RepID=UPI003690D792
MSDEERYRPAVGTHADAARTALLRPARPGRLDPALRAEAAALAAELSGQPAPAAAYRSYAPRSPDGAREPDSARAAAVRAYTRAVTLAPARAGRAELAELERVGLAAADIVALAQIVAFVSYEARVASGLALLDGAPAADTALAARALARSGPAEPATRRAEPDAPAVERPFTLDALTWVPWLEPVPADALDADQRAVLDTHATLSADSPYYRTLLHDPATLDHRTHLYNALMYGRGGLPRAERELVTLLVSRINGCVYCASVHGRKFAQLSRDPEAARRVLDEGTAALAGDPRRAALGRFTERQTATPPAATTDDVAALRAAGIDGAALLDVVHCVALFGWANRLMQVLGAPAVPESCTQTSGPAAAPAATPAAGSPSHG